MTLPTIDADADDLPPLIATVESCALGGLLHREYADTGHPHYQNQLTQNEDALMLAARDLVRAIDDLPPEDRPIGWDDFTYGPHTAPRALP